MPAQPPLWHGRPARPDDHGWLETPSAPPEPVRPPEPEEDEPRAAALPAGRIAALAAVLALLAAVIGGGLVALIGDSGNGTRTVEVPNATSGKPLATTVPGRVYAEASPGVVQIEAGNDSGTGFAVDGDGTIVTNAHVVENAQRVRIRFVDAAQTISGTVRGVDPSTDLAVVHIDPKQVSRLRVLPLGNSDQVRIGAQAVAIGYPFGLEQTATAGIISGLGRSISAPNGFSIDEVLQTDAPINPGNSGGPLLDAAGRVIGVNSQIATAGGGGGSVGIGFSIPVNEVKQVLPDLRAGRVPQHAYLGVSSGDASGGTGALVVKVENGSPAQLGGMRPGDLITKVAGKDVHASVDVSAAVRAKKPGDRIAIEVRRGGATKTLHADLGDRPAHVP